MQSKYYLYIAPQNNNRVVTELNFRVNSCVEATKINKQNSNPFADVPSTTLQEDLLFIHIMEKRDSTIFYRSFYEAIKELPDQNQLEVYNAIFEHSFNLNKPVLSGLTKTIYTLIEPQIEANLKRYANGNKPKKKQTESETEAKDKQTESKSEANKNNNNNENKNDNPSLVKKQIPKKVMFSESEFIDKAKFRDALPEWSIEKLRYYYEAVLTWSNEGNKKPNWIATVKSWERKDVAEGKIKFNTLKTELPKNWWNMDLTPEQWKLVPKEKVAEKENQDIRRKMGI